MTLGWDEETKQAVYSGYFNRSYDNLADDCQMDITVYKWGRTGGWTKFYSLSFTKPFDFVTSHFPEIYDRIWYPMGIRKKPVPPGVYYLRQYWADRITMKNFDALPYGKFKLHTKSTKGGKRPTCMQMDVDIYEVGRDQDLGPKVPLIESPLDGGVRE